MKRVALLRTIATLFVLVVSAKARSITANAAQSVFPRAYHIETKVIASIRMPFRTVCFTGIHGYRACSTENIRAESDELNMGRIYAVTVSAQMVTHETSRNWPDEQLIRESMRLDSYKLIGFESQPERPVTVPIQSGSPQPAGVSLMNFLPKSVKLVTRFWRHREGILA